MEKIMIREDDNSIKEELKTLLLNNGYEVVEDEPFDLALLDISMPGENGYDICAKIRKKSDVPVIFLTAKDTSENEILAFGVGADDFIRKPYNSSVLLARIARLLKRKRSSMITSNGLVLDIKNFIVSYNEKRTELTKNEARILYCIMSKTLTTREEIIEDLWENNIYIDDNTLSVNMCRLREKLKSIGAGGLIKTVRGVGYRL